MSGHSEQLTHRRQGVVILTYEILTPSLTFRLGNHTWVIFGSTYSTSFILTSTKDLTHKVIFCFI